MRQFECAVIGAGPAGACAAWALAKSGRSVALLEKHGLPRVKPCGGGVSPQVQDWLDFDVSPAVSLKATTFRCTWLGGDAVEGELERGACVWMVRRAEFDHLLVRQAAQSGAEILERCEALSLARTPGGWRIHSTRGELESRFVIAADGSKGPSAKWLGFEERKREIAGAIEAESPLVHAQDGIVHLEFGMVRGGYLWNFPKTDGHSVGIGAFKGRAPKNMKDLLAAYCRNFGIDLAATSRLGHPVAVWSGRQRLHGPNCLLAGEAACMVDPFTAEGIRPSIRTGILAAQAVHSALSGDTDALPRYSRLVHEEIGVDLAWARRIAGVFYAFPRIAYDRAIKSPRALEFLGDLFSGRRRYRDGAQSALAALRGRLIGAP